MNRCRKTSSCNNFDLVHSLALSLSHSLTLGLSSSMILYFQSWNPHRLKWTLVYTCSIQLHSSSRMLPAKLNPKMLMSHSNRAAYYHAFQIYLNCTRCCGCAAYTHDHLNMFVCSSICLEPPYDAKRSTEMHLNSQMSHHTRETDFIPFCRITSSLRLLRQFRFRRM